MLLCREAGPSDVDIGPDAAGGSAQSVRVADEAFARARLEAFARAFDRVELRATGDCMRPVLVNGARVGLERADLRPPRLGDIVLVRTKQGLRLHRLVWNPPFSRFMRTKGDRSSQWDSPVTRDDIIGTVVSSDSPNDPARGRLWRTFRSLAVLLRARLRRALVRGGR